MQLTRIAQDHVAEETCDMIFNGILAHLQRTDQNALWHRNMVKCLEETFAPHSPVTMHKHLSCQQYWQHLLQLRNIFAHDFRTEIEAMLVAFGFHADDIYWDRLVLRVVPPIGTYDKLADREHTPAHRDTWGVNIHSQMNWWSPLFPVASNRSMRFYPMHWSRPIANTTDSWSLQKYLQERKATAIPRKTNYPTMPQACCQPEGEVAAVVIPAGDWLLFSAAHLHDSAPNTSDLTRYSVEFRTVNRQHLKQGRAAINIDNKARSSMPRIFSRLTEPKERLNL